MRSLTLLVFVAAACGDSPLPIVAGDLASAGDFSTREDALGEARDFSVMGDLTPSPPPFTVDAGGFCAGTAAAGSCVALFFAQVDQCFRPAGACSEDPSGTECWPDGSRISWSPPLSMWTKLAFSVGTWQHGGVTCMTEQMDPGSVISDPPHRCIYSGGHTVCIYFDVVGTLTTASCDGMDFDPSWLNCPDIRAILTPACAYTPKC